MRKVSSLNYVSVAVDRLTTQTDYDNIVIVKNNLPAINTIASKLEASDTYRRSEVDAADSVVNGNSLAFAIALG